MRPTYRITLVSDAGSWADTYLPELARTFRRQGHRVRAIHRAADLRRGDFALILNFSEILRPRQLALHRHNLVVHASALPKGRGSAPISWQILNGARKIPVTLFEAAEKVDSGPIYLQGVVQLDGTELIDEVRTGVADTTIRLCRTFVDKYPGILKRARAQRGTPSFFPTRSRADSRLDPRKTLAAQFNLLRVVDNEAYPAYFIFRNTKYILKIYKAEPPP